MTFTFYDILWLVIYAILAYYLIGLAVGVVTLLIAYLFARKM